ncbi:MAG: AraC family transcriptional regulator [Armatimonadota bacterium]|nr:AraC family transcriptional regulator [Armatimonadota bacterium]
MARRPRIGEQGEDRVLEVYNPDYHLTTGAPLWAATHWHKYAGPPALSSHAGIEVGVVLAGREEIQVEGRVIGDEPGDVWLCAMSEPHWYRVVVPDTRNLVVIFLPSFLGEEMLGDKPWLTLFAAPPGERPRVTRPELRETVLAIAREMRREIEGRERGWECAVRLDLLRLLFHLSRGWEYPGATSAGKRGYAGSLSRIMPALALLYKRIPQLVSRAEAAEACGLGRSRFTMLFHETMGVSFKTFLRRARLAFAANILLTTDLPLDSVADKACFADASHLHHAFVGEYGCTPGQYREQIQATAAARRKHATSAAVGHD